MTIIFLLASLSGLGRRLHRLPAIRLDELDHLGDGLRRQDGQQVCYQEELVCLATDGLPRAELAQSDAFTVIGPAPTTIHQGRMKPMHVEVIIVDEKALTNSRVTIVQRVHIEPRSESENRKSVVRWWRLRLVTFLGLTRARRAECYSYARQPCP